MRSAVFALLLTAIAAAPAWASYQDGMAAYEAGDYETALEAFAPLAETGDARSQTALATLYFRGEGVEQDLRQARKWFAAAARQGDVQAQYRLGRMAYAGMGGAKDAQAAVGWLAKATDQGHVMASLALAKLYRGGKGVAHDNALSARYARQAADAGHPGAQYHLGLLYLSGEGVPKDEVEAYYWIFLAAQQGLIEAHQAMVALSRQLTSEQMMAAERRATEWRPKLPSGK